MIVLHIFKIISIRILQSNHLKNSMQKEKGALLNKIKSKVTQTKIKRMKQAIVYYNKFKEKAS